MEITNVNIAGQVIGRTQHLLHQGRENESISGSSH